MGRRKYGSLTWPLLGILVAWPHFSHAILKELSLAQRKEAIKWGEQYQFSDFFIDRAYQFGPTERQTSVLVVTKYYQLAKAAAKAGKERRPLAQEEINKILEATHLEIRFQINYERASGLFDFLFPRSPSLLGLRFQLKQRGKVVEPTRVVPPLASPLTGGKGTYRVYFPYATTGLRGTTSLVIIDPQGEEEEIKVNFSRLR